MFHDFPNRELEFCGEFKIALVVGRNGHDGSGAVAHQNVIGDPNRYLFSINRIDPISPGEDAGFFLVEFGPLQIALGRNGRLVFFHSVFLCGGGDALHQRMLGRENHVGRSEKRIRTGGENLHVALGIFYLEFYQGTLAAADPVSLKQLDALGPVEPVEALDETISKRRNAQHPLTKRATLDGKSADLALAINHFLVRQNGSKLRTPIYGHFGDIGQPHRIRLRAGVGVNRLGFARGGIEPGIVEF